MRRQLSEPIPALKLPQGFVIRPVRGTHEAEAVATMHRAAFGTDYMTTEKRLAIMNTSEYDPSLDLVVIAPDEAIAANCICSVNQISKVGSTDPIMTHPRFQRMGLAHALLLTGLRLLKERGMISAHLGTSGSNLAMQKTAESVGFTIESKTLWFSMEVN
jgi:ribosomal protein S18 acetylase RimI-like enzyme